MIIQRTQHILTTFIETLLLDENDLAAKLKTVKSHYIWGAVRHTIS